MNKNTNRFYVTAIIILLSVSNANAGMFTGPLTGEVTAEFVGPIPLCTGAVVCSGEGTNNISWGTALAGSTQSSILITSEPFTALASAVQFKIGDLSFQNGSIESDSGIVGITLSLDFGTVTGDGGAQFSDLPDPFELNIILINTPNTTGTPIGDQDSIIFSSAPLSQALDESNNPIFINTLNAFEGSTAEAELFFSFSSINFEGLGPALDPTMGSTSHTDITEFLVIEPSVIELLGIGMIGLLVVNRRKRRQASVNIGFLRNSMV